MKFFSADNKIIIYSEDGKKFIGASIDENGEIVTIELEQSEYINCTEKTFEKFFPIVEASKLSMNDLFMQHHPITLNQRKLFCSLSSSITSNTLKDFRKSIIDPSFNEDGNNIGFSFGSYPALGLSPEEWNLRAINFMPTKNSRIGSLQEYDAFLGIILKFLTDNNIFSSDAAWRFVCDDSRVLGNYYYTGESINEGLEPTGSRKIAGFYDLGNVCKIVKTSKNENNYHKMEGISNHGYYSPLSTYSHIPLINLSQDNAVGWIITDP